MILPEFGLKIQQTLILIPSYFILFEENIFLPLWVYLSATCKNLLGVCPFWPNVLKDQLNGPYVDIK